MHVSIRYSVLAYAPGEDDNERMWTGLDGVEARKVLDQMIARWPNVPVRLTVDTYYDPAPAGTCDARCG